MIVIAIIGVLATLAVASYQTYTVRAQVSEGVNFAGSLKAPIADAYTNGGVAPANRAAAGLSPLATDTRGNYVSSVDIVDGRIDVTYGGPLAHQDIVGAVLSITPYETSSYSIAWRCGNAAAPGGQLLNGGAEHIAPTVSERYLPSSCR